MGRIEPTPAPLDTEFEHEHVQLVADEATGLQGVVAIHSTALGPAMGGLRLRAYAGMSDALVDALRLSRAMSLKNAAADLDLGGGKAVLLDDGRWTGRLRDGRMRAVGRIVEGLGGRYITAEDVGTTPEDMEAIGASTAWVAGRPAASGGRDDPSPATARTVYGAIATAVRERFGADGLAGVHVGVQGVGHVGRRLAELLAVDGARLTVCDADGARAEAAARDLGAEVAPVTAFPERAMDVFAPCAMGEIVTTASVGRLRCRVVAGAANNPLAHAALAADLDARGILYMPDFLANCGGIIHVGAEVLGFDGPEVERRLAAAVDRMADVLAEARASARTPQDVAVGRALDRLRRPRVAAL